MTSIYSRTALKAGLKLILHRNLLSVGESVKIDAHADKLCSHYNICIFSPVTEGSCQQPTAVG
jgi:hypothetical protein